MNKFCSVAILSAGLAFASQAGAQGLAGVGWDTDLGEATARLELGMNAVDVGVGLSVDPENDNKDARFQMSLSGFFMGHLHDWGPVDTYFTAGGIFYKTSEANHNIHVDGFAGFQPEVTLLDHIVVSTRLGLRLALSPDFKLYNSGQGISIVNGANFKIVF